MARKLRLKKYELENVNYYWLGAFRLRVEASTVPGHPADPNVFLYQRNLPNPYDQTVTDVFIGIASPVDLADYPVGEPDTHTTYPFYRLPYFEVDLRSTEIAKEIWLQVVNEVDNLLKALDRMEQLVVTEEVTVGS